MNSDVFYVNEELMVGFPFVGAGSHQMSEPERILTQAEFDKLMVADPHPFGWAPGLIGDDMNLEEFLKRFDQPRNLTGSNFPP